MATPEFDDSEQVSPLAAGPQFDENEPVTPLEDREAADHGLSERQKRTPLGKALTPITDYPTHLKHMAKEAQDTIGEGWKQMTSPGSSAPNKEAWSSEGTGLWDIGAGAAKVAAGNVANAWAPVGAAYRSFVGQPVEDVTGIPREYTEFAAQLATPYIGIVGPKAAAPTSLPARPTLPANRFGVTESEGQATQDLTKIRAEQGAYRGQAGDEAARRAQEFLDVQQPAQVAEATRNVSADLNTSRIPYRGGELVERPTEAASAVQQRLQAIDRSQKANVKAKYDYAKSLSGTIDADVFRDMPSTLRNNLQNRTEPLYVDDGTPVAARMLRFLNDRIGQLFIRNDLATNQPIPSSIRGVNLTGIEQWRKGLVSMYGDALKAAGTNASDMRASQAILKEFDNHIANAVNSGAFAGDQRAVQAFNDARAAHSERMKMWGNDAIGRQLQKIIGDPRFEKDPATLNDVARWMYGESGSSNSLTVGTVKRMQKLLGVDSPEWATLKQGLFRQLVDRAGAPLGEKVVAKRLADFIDGKGSDLANAVYSPTERDMLRQFGQMHDRLDVPQAGANWPNTAGGVTPHIQAVGNRITGAVGALIGHYLHPLGGELAGWFAGEQLGKALTRSEQTRNARQVTEMMPTIAARYQQWQQAVVQQQRLQNAQSRLRLSATATNLTTALAKLERVQPDFAKLLTAGQSSPGNANANDTPQRARGGKLTPQRLLPDSGDNPDTDQLADTMIEDAVEFAGHAGGGSVPIPRPRPHREYEDFHQVDPDQIIDRRNQEPGSVWNDKNYFPAGYPQGEPFTSWYMHPQPTGPMPDALGADQLDKMGLKSVAAFAEGGTPNYGSDDDAGPGVVAPQPEDDSWKDREAQENLAVNTPEPEGPGVLATAADAAKRFGTYVSDIPGNVAHAGKWAYEHPGEAAQKAGQLVGLGDKERYQTWPERMIRSGATAAGDAMSGELPAYEIDPKTGEAHTSEAMIERAQDMSALGGAGGIGGVEEGAARGLTSQELGAQNAKNMTLGAGPFLRPAVKYEGKLYKAPMREGAEHADAMPESVYQEYMRQGMSGQDMNNFTLGFLNHKGQFLNRDQALDYGVKEGLIDPHDARAGTLVSTMLRSDTSEPGAAVAGLSKSPFYSQVEKTIAESPQSKMQGSQWANWLKNQPGVKQEELEWSGLNKFLQDQKGPVTRGDVMEFFAQKKTELKDVTKGEGVLNDQFKSWDELESDERMFVKEHLLEMLQNNAEDEPSYIDRARDIARHGRWHPDVREQYEASPDVFEFRKPATKYHDYTMPGGENYRENLLTLPRKAATDEDIAAGRARTDDNGNPVVGDAYKSRHWDEPNVLLHTRTNERDVEGVPSHHIEEIQSDWHQAGRKEGYAGQWDEKARELAKQDGEDWEQMDDRMRRAYVNDVRGSNTSGVPDAPFKTSWPELALKREIRRAAEEGKDRISWTPGEAQADRYGLHRHVEEVRAYEQHDGTYDLVGLLNGGGSFHKFGKSIPKDKIADYLGKEVTERLFNKKPFSTAGGNTYSLEGTDLKAGGEGMKGFYDNMLPKIAEKLGKQYGVKVKQGQLPPDSEKLRSAIRYADSTGDRSKIAEAKKTQPVWYFDIPSKMKDDVLKKGMPLFSDTSHGAALSANEKKDVK